MAGGPAPSQETGLRRAVRLALGTAVVFVAAQLLAWPLAQLSPAFAVILLLDPDVINVRQALGILATTIIAFVSGYLLAVMLLPYPAVLLLTISLLVYRFYIFVISSGGHLLAIVGMLIGCICIPVVTKLLPELAIIVSIGMLINFMIAILSAWVAYLLIPAPVPRDDAHHHQQMDPEEVRRLAMTMTIVAAPMQIAFLLFGWTSIVVLVYAMLIAPGLSSEGSLQMGWDKVVANLIFGGLGMLLFYEAMVAAPNVILLASLAFLFAFIFGIRIFSGSHSSGLWLSGIFGFLILIGGALLAENVFPSVKVIDRIVQIILASAYVVFAYRIIDLLGAMAAQITRRS